MQRLAVEQGFKRRAGETAELQRVAAGLHRGIWKDRRRIRRENR